MVKQLAVNYRIQAREVRLIGKDGEQLGILSFPRALQVAKEAEMDLVEVSPAATPPVCRVLDYGKYRYEQTKKDRKAKRGQKTGLLKELRLRPKIEEHDLQAKLKMARRFLEDGNKLRLVVRFRGREIVYPELGLKVLRKVTESLDDIATGISTPTKDRRTLSLTLSPKSNRKPKEVKTNAKAQDTQGSKKPL
ncbi:MAG: translation initiation factor IF-3 [Dehalococcoidia bacterium]|nr:translation initiation factor IF-3 [Dehalococcoidia bacterium]